MSKIAVVPLRLPFDDGNVVDAEIPEPGEIIGNFVHHDPTEPALLDRNGAKRDPTALVVVLRIDPDRPRRLRRFVKLSVNRVMEAPDADQLEHLCTFTNPISGEVIALFEAAIDHRSETPGGGA